MDLLAFALKKENARLAMIITLETLSHLQTKIATINVLAIQDATSTPTMIQAMNKFITNVFCCLLAIQKHLVDLDATLEISIATSPFQHPQHQRQRQRLQPLHVVLVFPHGLRPPGRSGGGGGPHGPVAAAAEAAVRGGRTVAASSEVCPCCVRGELLLVQLLGPINHCCSSAWAPAINIICLFPVQTFKKESDPC